MEAMDEDLVVANSNSLPHATSSTSIGDYEYGFVMTIRPTIKTVSLTLRDICEPDGNSTESASLSRKALYPAVNKKVNDLDVTPISHSLSDWARDIVDDDQLQELFELES